jgi:uncharacterized membrane protein YfcA
LLIIAGGLIAGFINTLAGSGSLVTLPILIFIGLPATVANGTNRIAILLQNVVGVTSFNKKKVLDVKGVLYLGIPATIGSIIGANIAVNINEDLMSKVIGVIMVLMLFVIIVRPNRWLVGTLDVLDSKVKFWQIILFFFIGIYGGFIQAGVGIFLLSGLVLGIGYNVVRANAVKVGIVLFFTIFALGIFIYNGQVDFIIGFILAIGNMIGAWLGAKVAVEKGSAWIRRLLIAIVIVSAANLLGVFELISNLISG